ncbi:MAG TPA: ATP-dependent DNA helicase [Bacteriovoracaceae bacterium]|nr:ATP-dependent DNA helicase [Bacteriovoracaceae bacterium]
MKNLKLSIQDFATPSPRTGSLSAGSGGFGQHMQRGIELHQLVQRKRKTQNPLYQSEKKISQVFERDNWKFQIEGRMDGFIAGEVARIEEIKTTMNMKELHESLIHDPYAHAYGLQLLTYGYFYWLENNSVPELTFHLISTRTNKSLDFDIVLETDKYATWLDLRLSELSIEALKAEKRVERRKKLAAKMVFPFLTPRPGQMELIQTVEETLEAGNNLLLQAPTGLGKTIGVLYPSLKESLKRGQKVIYVTPKNSQQQVVEEALERMSEQGCKSKSLTLTARSKICMKEEALCDPLYCEYAKDYYDKLNQHNIKDLLAKKRSFTARTFKKIAEEFKVCPFELQGEAMEEADTVIGDYNHVFGARTTLGKTSLFNFVGDGKPNLIIDEAHNLPARTMDQFSPSVSIVELEALLPGMDAGGSKLINECLALIKEHSGIKRVVELDVDAFIDANEKLKKYLGESFEQTSSLQQGSMLKFAFKWMAFVEVLELIFEGGVFFTGFYPEVFGGTLKITCCDASELIREKYESYAHVVAFSATVKPFDFYSKLSGLNDEKLKVAEFFSPYLKSQRKILVIPQISTKYSERERNYSRIAATISKVTSLKSGNYLAFFPSFDFMEKTIPHLELADGFQLRKQSRYMKRGEVESVLTELKEQGSPLLLCGVQGGMFSEGIDYPGRMVIGAFIIGPPLPNFDFEREKMREYYQESYNKGFEFAYAYPAMAKAVQAAGRVIRSETDHGLIVMMDNRFLGEQYYKTMPQDWFEKSPQELVSTGILEDVKQFWATTPY